MQLLGSGFLHGPELQGSRDPLHVEALEQTANRLGRDARAAAVDREAEGRAVQPGVRRREERSRTLATRLVCHRQLEPELGPFVGEAPLELVELFD